MREITAMKDIQANDTEERDTHMHIMYLIYIVYMLYMTSPFINYICCTLTLTPCNAKPHTNMHETHHT